MRWCAPVPRPARPGRRARRLVLAGALAIAVLTAAAFTWGSAWATFTVATPTYSTTWSTGTVVLADDDAGRALLLGQRPRPRRRRHRVHHRHLHRLGPALVPPLRQQPHDDEVALLAADRRRRRGHQRRQRRLLPSPPPPPSTAAPSRLPDHLGAGVDAWTTAGSTARETRSSDHLEHARVGVHRCPGRHGPGRLHVGGAGHVTAPPPAPWRQGFAVLVASAVARWVPPACSCWWASVSPASRAGRAPSSRPARWSRGSPPGTSSSSGRWPRPCWPSAGSSWSTTPTCPAPCACTASWPRRTARCGCAATRTPRPTPRPSRSPPCTASEPSASPGSACRRSGSGSTACCRWPRPSRSCSGWPPSPCCTARRARTTSPDPRQEPRWRLRRRLPARALRCLALGGIGLLLATLPGAGTPARAALSGYGDQPRQLARGGCRVVPAAPRSARPAPPSTTPCRRAPAPPRSTRAAGAAAPTPPTPPAGSPTRSRAAPRRRPAVGDHPRRHERRRLDPRRW